mmetsp:Transcript_4239/g.6017  ORF Transcript_4239/g.6017 Transcript_4239/m.6017 type:complete len:226 (+) Transcript_4239:1161-1838(+)
MTPGNECREFQRLTCLAWENHPTICWMTWRHMCATVHQECSEDLETMGADLDSPVSGKRVGAVQGAGRSWTVLFSCSMISLRELGRVQLTMPRSIHLRPRRRQKKQQRRPLRRRRSAKRGGKEKKRKPQPLRGKGSKRRCHTLVGKLGELGANPNTRSSATLPSIRSPSLAHSRHPNQVLGQMPQLRTKHRLHSSNSSKLPFRGGSSHSSSNLLFDKGSSRRRPP